MSLANFHKNLFVINYFNLGFFFWCVWVWKEVRNVIVIFDFKRKSKYNVDEQLVFSA